jgi:RNA polymerase sigma factor (sigma-70 family)
VEDERTLINRLRARDEAAFAELIERYYGYLLPLASFFVSNRAVAEEVVQEAWLAVLKGIDRFEERSSFKTWISRIVMNLARTRGVRESRMVPFSEFADNEIDRPEAAVDPSRFRSAGDEYPDHWSVAPRPWNADPETQLLTRRKILCYRRRNNGRQAQIHFPWDLATVRHCCSGLRRSQRPNANSAFLEGRNRHVREAESSYRMARVDTQAFRLPLRFQ